ncbi:S66 peptidase family protein [Brevibacillus fluminis]|uniref:S66 peptidase family protein n=1 Tax=Brevibacillus fluminis TaxID=511487 RepID=UPI001FE2B79D|nr:LD-carboxypeptidase [Brevibacillus fluminis]
MLKKGKALKTGDTIGIVATSTPMQGTEDLERGVAELEALGYHVIVSETCYERYGGYLAGPAELRASELTRMFTDPEVDAVFAMRGGYGASQMLPLLDYDAIAANPKLFLGYSDITALHLALGKKAGLATLHAPTISTSYVSGLSAWSNASLFHTITTTEPLGEIRNPEEEKIECIVPGEASGPIVGGNLALVSALMGTPYEIETKGKLLFLEDVNEEPYKIDRMLTQLALAGKLEEAAGFILGTFTRCTSTRYADGFSVHDVINTIIAPLGKPTIWNVQVGHGKTNLSLPFGVQAHLHAEAGSLRLEENFLL